MTSPEPTAGTNAGNPDMGVPAFVPVENEHLRHLLKRRRVELGLSQLKVATLMNISTSTAGRWERGEKSVAYSRCQEISEIFSVPMEHVLIAWHNADQTAWRLARRRGVRRWSPKRSLRSPENLERERERRRERRREDPAYRKKLSEYQARYRAARIAADPDYGERVREQQNRYYRERYARDPEYRAKKNKQRKPRNYRTDYYRERNRRQRADPAYRAREQERRRERRRERFAADPEYRERERAWQREYYRRRKASTVGPGAPAR